MYLKSIEVNGFKSFANRLVFQFEHGFTGIVGPNGSGKSNVADAVRWVLGEQSAKQLRGSKMEDVIFAGTENRKPLGFAYVALTMDNSDHSLPVDYDEVIVARRVYRSGESEYLLNGSPCRLKDVQSMFFDTGVGKEGYSIIGQGQIDKILSGKAEERRELFDEAAGIVKYKKNKAATEKSLEQERDNLSRVNDILGELTKQVGPLKEQSETAKKYLQYKEELKTLEVNVFLLETDEIKEQIEQVEKKSEIVTQDLEQTEKQIAASKKEYDELEQKKEQFEVCAEKRKAAVTDCKLAIEKSQGEINVFNEQINTAKMNDAHITKRLTQIEESLIAKSGEKEKLYEKKSVLDEQLDEIDESRTKAEEDLQHTRDTIDSLRTRIQKYKTDIDGFISETAELKSKVSRYDAMLENVQLRKVELNQRLLKNRSAQQEQEHIKEENQTLRKEVREKAKQLIKQLDDQEKKLKELSEKEAWNKERLTRTEQQFHSSRSKLETLKNMAERYDGYGNSIKRVMEEKKKNPNIHGVVADIISVRKDYEVAVETALGGSIQNIVTQDEQTAKEMITILKKERAGRATFLPLTSISPRGSFRQPEVLNEKGVVGLANTLVQVEDRYKKLMEYLLGRIIVVDNIDHAIALARKYQQSLRIVTCEGESINPGGAMSGGTFRNNSNLLGRKREMEELQKQIEESRAVLQEAKEQEESLKQNTSELESTSERLTAQLQEYKIQDNTYEINMKQAEDKITELTQSVKVIAEENKKLDEQTQSINEEKKALYAGNVEQEEAKTAREKAISQLEEEIQKLSDIEKEKQNALNESQMKFQSVEQETSFIMTSLKRIKGEEDVLNAEKEELIQKTGCAYDEMEAITHKIAQCRQSIEAQKKQMEKEQQELDALERKQEEVRFSHKEVFDRHESLTNRKAELDKEKYRLETQKEKLSEQNQNLKDYMWTEYELTYFHAVDLKNEEMDNLLELKKKTDSVKKQIKSLGDVNVNAIEEYKEVSSRYEFLQAQHDDIVEAEKNLLGIIEELDVAMRTQFNEKFAEIQLKFSEVFQEMFGGGKASLILEEGDELTAGIQINGQPPGKKLQNMMQLSGGEKALTAIALLFAIQSLRPSPFCLLDEIEAALDDSNVDRFANYIHKLTAHTQFIVITHRRGTMTAADVLYGITMQEKGVSTLVSVNLIEDQLEDKA